MIQPQGNPQIYYKMLHQKRETELFLSALRLRIFSALENLETANSLAKKTNLNERSLSFYLNSLACIGLLEKHENKYRNTKESNEFLNENSPLYLGEHLLFREKMMSLANLDERIQTGADAQIITDNSGVNVYDFYESARVSIPEMYTGRVQALLAALSELYKDGAPKKILDLGGGNGILAIETVSAFPGCQGVIFEHPSVAKLPQTLVEQHKLAESIKVIAGDFNVDGLGGEYDLIIASGILDFAGGDPDKLLNKLYHALLPNGYLYLVSHTVSADYQSPPEVILGWLSSHLDGLDILLTRPTIESALIRQGFTCVQSGTTGGIFKDMPGKFYRRSLA